MCSASKWQRAPAHIDAQGVLHELGELGQQQGDAAAVVLRPRRVLSQALHNCVQPPEECLHLRQRGDQAMTRSVKIVPSTVLR